MKMTQKEYLEKCDPKSPIHPDFMNCGDLLDLLNVRDDLRDQLAALNVQPAEPTDAELDDLKEWLDDGFGFNDPAGAALAELAQSERNHEAVDAASPL